METLHNSGPPTHLYTPKTVCGSNFFIIKPTRCTNFTNLFCHETLHVSNSSSVHHQEFIHCTLSSGIHDTGLQTVFEQDQDGTGFILLLVGIKKMLRPCFIASLVLCTPRNLADTNPALLTQWVSVFCMDIRRNSDCTLWSSKWLAFITEKLRVYCAVGTESLNITHVNFRL
jgi:hypothetical protein